MFSTILYFHNAELVGEIWSRLCDTKTKNSLENSLWQAIAIKLDKKRFKINKADPGKSAQEK
jgi:hypothetical protein